MDRIHKLLAIVFVAFVWAYKAGIYLNEICPIRIKTTGRKAKSLFKYGPTLLANTLFGNDLDKLQCIANLCHVLRLLKLKTSLKVDFREVFLLYKLFI